MALVPVKFKVHALVYNPGDVAGFEPDYAANLIKRGIAEPFVVKQPEPAKAPEPVAEPKKAEPVQRIDAGPAQPEHVAKSEDAIPAAPPERGGRGRRR